MKLYGALLLNPIVPSVHSGHCFKMYAAAWAAVQFAAPCFPAMSPGVTVPNMIRSRRLLIMCSHCSVRVSVA